MNSCLYDCTVMHNRMAPKKNWFQYRIFMFYIDLDELDMIRKKIWLISRNRFNVFNFRDKDHLEFPRENPVKGKTTKENILTYLKDQGVDIDPYLKGEKRIMLLTNLCTWGYQFNPVSFYFFSDKNDQPECSVIEIGNTFLEQKPFFLGKELLDQEAYRLKTPKYFYVSPFTDLDDLFDFRLRIPGDKLDIKIDDYKSDGTRFFVSTLQGKRVELTNINLLGYALRFPLITVKVIFLIHWQAMKLWLRGLPYRKKITEPELQQEVYKPYKASN